MKTVYVVHAKHEAEQEHQIVGIYSDQKQAKTRLSCFAYGRVETWTLNKAIPYNDG